MIEVAPSLPGCIWFVWKADGNSGRRRFCGCVDPSGVDATDRRVRSVSYGSDMHDSLDPPPPLAS
jgi:hypothetical protein